MIDEGLHFSGGVSLVGGGDPSAESIEESLKIAPFLVAADGGADFALNAGFKPEVVIGDFDSVTATTRAALNDARFIEVAEQYSTDFEKCLTRIEAPFVIATGFTSRRLDHTLAALSTLVRVSGPPTVLLGETDIVFAAPPRLSLDLPVGMRASLFPLSNVEGTSVGLEWPIDGLKFAPDFQIGTSNRVTGPVELAFHQPGMLIILPRAALANALAGLIG